MSYPAHPAFANIPNQFVAEVLSEPFIKAESFVAFDNVYPEHYEETPASLVPIAVGVCAIENEDTGFALGFNQHVATPIGNAVGYMEAYRRKVSKGQGPMFEGSTDSTQDLEIINRLQGLAIRRTHLTQLKVVAGFMIGRHKADSRIESRFIMPRSVVEEQQKLIGAGYSRMVSHPIPPEGVNDISAEDFTGTAVDLLLVKGSSMLLPTYKAIKELIVSNMPAVDNHLKQPGKVQQRALKLERRRAASAFN